MTSSSKQPNREKADGEERASLEALVETVIGAAHEVSNVLGAGFVETEQLAQCINYLKASGLKLALLINFRRPKIEWRRIVHNL